MPQIIRVSVDVVVKKGDPQRLVQALSKKENRQTVANYVSHVLTPDVMETAEVEPSGAFVHIHDHESTGSCSVDKKEASAYLPNFR
jgi:hypothetical protein